MFISLNISLVVLLLRSPNYRRLEFKMQIYRARISFNNSEEGVYLKDANAVSSMSDLKQAEC
jgi:hypothetical protein